MRFAAQRALSDVTGWIRTHRASSTGTSVLPVMSHVTSRSVGEIRAADCPEDGRGLHTDAGERRPSKVGSRSDSCGGFRPPLRPFSGKSKRTSESVEFVVVLGTPDASHLPLVAGGFDRWNSSPSKCAALLMPAWAGAEQLSPSILTTSPSFCPRVMSSGGSGGGGVRRDWQARRSARDHRGEPGRRRLGALRHESEQAAEEQRSDRRSRQPRWGAGDEARLYEGHARADLLVVGDDGSEHAVLIPLEGDECGRGTRTELRRHAAATSASSAEPSSAVATTMVDVVVPIPRAAIHTATVGPS